MTATLLTVLVTVFASSGFWALVQMMYINRSKAKSEETKMLLGLGHDRIYELCKEILRTGEITHEEYDNLLHLYEPYQALGGNGTAEKMMQDIKDLPFSD